MACPVRALPAGTRLTDFISLGVITRSVPLARIHSVLAATGKQSVRQRDLPAHVVVYYVIALALYMQCSYREVLRCLLEGLAWLRGPRAELRIAGKSGISQARARLGAAPLQRLHDELVGPVASLQTKGAWYRQWRLVSLDGSCLDIADEPANVEAFGRPGASRGQAGYPQLRFVAVVENGTHVLFGSRLGPYATGEITLAHAVMDRLVPGMLCLADRNFFGFGLWTKGHATGADLLWRIKRNLRLARETDLPDGSYLSRIYRCERDWRHQTNGVVVRVIDYELDGVADAEPLYRLITTLLDPEQAPASELAALYHERWEIETALAELKTRLRGTHIVLRSRTPEMVRQEFYGLMLAHFAIRQLIHEAALRADEDPDRLSFLHAVRVVRRRLPAAAALSPSPATAPV
jgi:hypothetical protein